MRRLALIVPILLTLMAVPAVAAPAQAEAPPPTWSNHRVLDCDGVDVDTYLAPPGFGTPFNVVDSTDVIIPVHVTVTWPDGGPTRVTFDKPGFVKNVVPTVHCTYTDPSRLFIDFYGIRV